MTNLEAVDYIFDNIDSFKQSHAEQIERLESLGIDSRMALSMVITIAAVAKSISDASGRN